MLATINTDASFCPNNKLGSYAFWISSNEGIFKRHGSFKEGCPTPFEAELKAIINALHFCATHPKLKHVSRIIVNTDCAAIVNMMSNPKSLKKRRQKHLKILKEHADKYLTDNFEFRHVKAHKKSDNSREYVNDWLDKKARKELKKSRKNYAKNIKRQAEQS